MDELKDAVARPAAAAASSGDEAGELCSTGGCVRLNDLVLVVNDMFFGDAVCGEMGLIDSALAPLWSVLDTEAPLANSDMTNAGLGLTTGAVPVFACCDGD